jgi:hypothetical protein
MAPLGKLNPEAMAPQHPPPGAHVPPIPSAAPQGLLAQSGVWHTWVLAMQGALPGHEPQSRVPPQPSASEPHWAPCAAQVVGVQLHWLETHVPWAQSPHDSVPPQVSGTEPQAAPWAAQVVGVQPQRWARPPPPQVSGSEHDPQDSTLPQPSGTCPHSASAVAQVSGSHGPLPHRLGPPPPQISPPLQSPHSTISPQPFGTDPQFAPRDAQVPGLHPHWLGTPPPPHVSYSPHDPQFNASLQPSDTNPQEAFSCTQVLGEHADIPHWFGPPPPHVRPEGHAPQITMPPHGSGTDPHCAPNSTHVRGVQSCASSPIPASEAPSVAPSACPSHTEPGGGKALPSGEAQPPSPALTMPSSTAMPFGGNASCRGVGGDAMVQA